MDIFYLDTNYEKFGHNDYMFSYPNIDTKSSFGTAILYPKSRYPLEDRIKLLFYDYYVYAPKRYIHCLNHQYGEKWSEEAFYKKKQFFIHRVGRHIRFLLPFMDRNVHRISDTKTLYKCLKVLT
jgi:hypothetical protein